jgi:hypothetical protein
MSALINVGRELARLFVDDGWLALAILGVVAVASIVSALVPNSLAAGAVLLLGCLGVLVANVACAAWR